MIFEEIEGFLGLEKLNNLPPTSEIILNSECDEEPKPPG